MVSYRRYWLNNAVVHIFESIQLLGVGGSLRDEPHWGLSMTDMTDIFVQIAKCIYVKAGKKKNVFTSFREFRFSLGWGEAWGMRIINDTHRKFREALEELFYRLVSRGLMVFEGKCNVTPRNFTPDLQLFFKLLNSSWHCVLTTFGLIFQFPFKHVASYSLAWINNISIDDIDISIWFIGPGRSYHHVNKWYWKPTESFLNKARLSLIFDWSWIGISFIDCARHYKFNYTGNSHHSLVSHNKLFIFPSKFTAF